jgi:hypothetical protein
MPVSIVTPVITQVDLTDKIDLVGNVPLVLPRYDEACRAVAELKTVDEVDEIIARADAIRAYAKQARNRQLELDAAEIRIRAERRVGELMLGAGRTLGKAAGARGIGTSAGYQLTRTPEDPPTLTEAGIDKNLANRARALAAVPDEKFEELLDEKRHRNDRRVVLDPEVPVDAIAPGTRSRKALAAENERLSREVTALRREVGELQEHVEMWKERAEGAGWTERAHAGA